MKKIITYLVCTLSCIICFSFVATAQQTKKISLQGFLKDPNGKAVENNDKFEITFKLYPVLTGGTAEWSETQILSISGGCIVRNLVKQLRLKT